MKAPEVFLLHAYSPRNSGDGLLVKLSVKIIREASLSQRITVVCLDKAAFSTYLEDGNISLMSVPEFLAHSIRRIFSRKPTIFFGVGGGYLRAGTVKEGWKTLIAHGAQVIFSALNNRSLRIYLPQSVGPFRGLSGSILTRLIRRNVDTLFVRDDKSGTEIRHERAIRMPDLVVLEIDRQGASIPGLRISPIKRRNVYFVFRDLSSKSYNDSYIRNIKELVRLIPDAKFALQSEGRGNSDDVFYRDVFGVGNATRLRDVIAQRDGVVVSVRLHGSLESLLGGIPSVHLAYERKGAAAYSDLGIQDYVFHASAFDPNLVASLVEQLRVDPTPFWSRLDERRSSRHNEIVKVIQDEIAKFNYAFDGR